VAQNDRDRALEKVLSAINKGFGADAAVRLNSNGLRSEVREVIPTGMLPLDHYLLGCGGLPVGRISEVFGDEASGKTSFQLLCIAAAQKEGGIGIVADAEHALSEDRMATFGCDPDGTILLQPNSMEECIAQITASMRAVPSGVGPNIMCWDSIAASPPKAELEGEPGDHVVGVRARLLNTAMRVWTGLAVEKRFHLMCINQQRDKIGVMFGDPTTTPGGKSVKFASSIRLKLLGVKPVKSGESRTGQDVTIRSAKNKLAAPGREVVCRLNFENGWDADWTLLNHAKEMGCIEQGVKMSAKALVDAKEALGWADGDPKKLAAETRTALKEEK
jgi:recombination protein RecA